MRQVATGDVQAFECLLARHLDSIHHYLVRLTGVPADAEDLAQETFLRLWLKAGSFRPGRVRVATWLHRIAHNAAVDLLRKPGRDGQTLDFEPVAQDPGPETLQHWAQEQKRLAQALNALSANQRSAVLLRHQQGLSNPDVAEVLGVSVRAVESLLSRARRQLKSMLAEPGSSLGNL